MSQVCWTRFLEQYHQYHPFVNQAWCRTNAVGFSLSPANVDAEGDYICALKFTGDSSMVLHKRPIAVHVGWVSFAPAVFKHFGRYFEIPTLGGPIFWDMSTLSFCLDSFCIDSDENSSDSLNGTVTFTDMATFIEIPAGSFYLLTDDYLADMVHQKALQLPKDIFLIDKMLAISQDGLRVLVSWLGYQIPEWQDINDELRATNAWKNLQDTTVSE
mgnify:CR=1 FL=1